MRSFRAKTLCDMLSLSRVSRTSAAVTRWERGASSGAHGAHALHQFIEQLAFLACHRFTSSFALPVVAGPTATVG
jgi:hypothetical protein